MDASVFANISNALLSATTNSTWVPDGIEDIARGHEDVLHIFSFILGLSVASFGQQSPRILAVVSSVSFGAWLGLVLRDRQRFKEHFMGHEYPKGIWLPVIAFLLATWCSGILVFLTWRVALALLTAGLTMLLVLAVARLFNVSPDRVFEIGASALSAYRLVGALVLLCAFCWALYMVIRRKDLLQGFTSACLGALLLLSGISHFVQRLFWDGAAFSLLDDLARIISDVRGGRCNIWRTDSVQDDWLRGCDCSDLCRVEISAWIGTTVFIFLSRWLAHKAFDQYPKDKSSTDEEMRPLKNEDNETLEPQVFGASLVDAEANSL